jgi:hypothetical protein
VRLAWLAELRRSLDLYLSAGPAAKVAAEDLYKHVLLWKGAASARQIEDRLARGEPKFQPVHLELARTREQLARTAFPIPPNDRHREWLKQLDRLRLRKTGAPRGPPAWWAAFALSGAGRQSPSSAILRTLPFFRLSQAAFR